MPLIHSEDLRLQALRIPVGFSVQWNEFYDILDSGKEIFFEDYPNTLPYELYKSTLLILTHTKMDILIDLGWGPEHDSTGSFWINVVHAKNQNWREPIYKFSSRNKDEIVDKLNELMAGVAAGKIK